MHIYKIQHAPTGKAYIGKTVKLPMNRWAQHFASLKSNTHRTPAFQLLWNEHPDLSEWVCYTLWSGPGGGWELKYKEAEYLRTIPEDLRLNEPNTAVVTLDMHDQVRKLLSEGVTYMNISKMVGVSMGTISNIKRGLS